MRCVARRSLVLGAAALGVAAFAGFAGPAKAEEKLQIVATTAMVGDAVAAIAGGRAEISVLMGPGVDPHAYRQTRSDVVKMGQADAVFYNGLYLEAQLEELLLELDDTKPVVPVAEALPRDLLLGHDDYADKFDPHVWMVPELWAGVVEATRDALIEIDPESASHFEERAEAYLTELAALGGYATEVLGSVPESRRMLITAHDAFNYFGEAYDFEVLGIQGISTESEAGLQEIERLVDIIVERGITAVFVESTVSDRNVRALIEGAAARGQEVAIGGELFSDAMGDPGSYVGSYLGMIDHNATLITRQLGGEAPAEGRLGRLGEGGQG